jgi:hypothetical protein
MFDHQNKIFFSWSFGVFLFEMFSLGDTPYVGVQQGEVLKFVEDGNRLPRPRLASDEMCDILVVYITQMEKSCRHEMMQSCWLVQTDQRISFKEIHDKLWGLLDIKSAGYGYLPMMSDSDIADNEKV